MWKPIFLTFVLSASGLQSVLTEPQWNYSFAIDYENDQFLLDGNPFRYVSGSFHYFRAPRAYWRDRLAKLRAAGLNAVSTYVEWSLHQPEPERWDWSGEADLAHFLSLAQEEGLLVLLRPGPYICAERDLGGLPTWLFTLVPDIQLRTNDTRFMEFARIYINEVMSRVQPFLRGNGGPVIMVQVENEYGSFGACNQDYMKKLRDLMRQQVGTNALLYTTDGAGRSYLKCGAVPDVYATVDFGTQSDVTKAFASMRMFEPKGPLVNSEFYPGWLTHWEEPFQQVGTHAITRTLDEMLAQGASVNFYVFFGGTNFGFTSGANTGDKFSPQLTSYDYDAPLTEAGDPTPKYFAIRDVISKYLPVPDVPRPEPAPKGDYGSVFMQSVVDLFSPVAMNLLGTKRYSDEMPMPFEAMGTQLPIVLYEAALPLHGPDPGLFYADVRDRAQVYVDRQLVGTLSRTRKIKTMPFEDPYAKRLKLLVENQGHVNYGNEIVDLKGALNVSLNGLPLSPWNMTGFQLDDVSLLNGLPVNSTQTEVLHLGPVFLRGTFTVQGDPLDTYLDTGGWGKGVAYVNGHNLGRYWPLAGPQITLYVPAPFMRTGENTLILLELEYVPRTKKIKFQTVPNMSTKHTRL